MSWSTEQALIVDSDPHAPAALTAVLSAAGYECDEREEAGGACVFVRQMRGGLVLTGLELPARDGMEILAAAQRRSPEVGALVVSGTRDAEVAVKALQVGALD